MADGSGPKRNRGKRSHIGDQCQWAMDKELGATRMKPEGFVLLEITDLVARLRVRWSATGMSEGSQPDHKQIRRWQVQKLKGMGL